MRKPLRGKFWTISYREFPVHLNFLPEFLEFSVEGIAFRKFNNSRIFRKLPRAGNFRSCQLNFLQFLSYQSKFQPIPPLPVNFAISNLSYQFKNASFLSSVSWPLKFWLILSSGVVCKTKSKNNRILDSVVNCGTKFFRTVEPRLTATSWLRPLYSGPNKSSVSHFLI